MGKATDSFQGKQKRCPSPVLVVQWFKHFLCAINGALISPRRSNPMADRTEKWKQGLQGANLSQVVLLFCIILIKQKSCLFPFKSSLVFSFCVPMLSLVFSVCPGSDCPERRFGIGCVHPCNCTGAPCDKVTGHCKCPAGTSGRHCENCECWQIVFNSYM